MRYSIIDQGKKSPHMTINMETELGTLKHIRVSAGLTSTHHYWCMLRRMKVRYFDIAVNLTDSMFQGAYNGKPYHASDINQVILKAGNLNVDQMLVTGSSLHESESTMDIIQNFHKSYPDSTVKLHSTIGVHPCSVKEFLPDPRSHIEQLRQLVKKGLTKGICTAFGEIGLDYDRLHYASAEEQKEFFELQLKLACEFKLPLFLHMRAACSDFIDIIKPFLENTRSDGLNLANPIGVVHSFTGTEEELDQLLELGFYIGVNGCSLRNQENLNVAARIPLDRLMIETDSPWCEVRKSHASYQYLTPSPNDFYPTQVEPEGNMLLPFASLKKDKVKSIGVAYLVRSRNEPCLVGHIAEIISKIQEKPPHEVIEACYKNASVVFGN